MEKTKRSDDVKYSSNSQFKSLTKKERHEQIRKLVGYYIRKDYRKFKEISYSENLTYGIDIIYTFKTDGTNNYVLDTIKKEIRRIAKINNLNILIQISFITQQIRIDIYETTTIPF